MVKENKAEVDAFIFANGVPPQWEVISANDVLRHSIDVGGFPSSYRPVMKMFGAFSVLYMYILIVLYRAKEKLLLIEGIDISEIRDYDLEVSSTGDYYGWKVVPKDGFGHSDKHWAQLIAERFLLLLDDIPLWEKAIVAPFTGVYTADKFLYSDDYVWAKRAHPEMISKITAVEESLQDCRDQFMDSFYKDLPLEDDSDHSMFSWACTLLWQAMALNDADHEDAPYFKYKDNLGYTRIHRAALVLALNDTSGSSTEYDRFVMFCTNLQLAWDRERGMWPSNHYPRGPSLSLLGPMIQSSVYINKSSFDIKHFLTVLERLQLGPTEDWTKSSGPMLHKHIRAIQQSVAYIRVPTALFMDVFSADSFKMFVAHIRRWGGYSKLDGSAWTIERHMNDRKEAGRMEQFELYFLKGRIQILGSILTRHAGWMQSVGALPEDFDAAGRLDPGIKTVVRLVNSDVAHSILSDPSGRTISEEE